MRMKNFSGRIEGDQGYTRLRLLKHTVFSGTGIKGFKRDVVGWKARTVDFNRLDLTCE